MPITFSFDLDNNDINDPNDRTRIQVAFLRFGWEHIGGSSWRYPSLESSAETLEDWFNHVIPALMYFRSIAEHGQLTVTKFSLDAHSETGYKSTTIGGGIRGSAILTAAAIPMFPPNLTPPREAILSEERLREFFASAADSLE
jgi:hypothetical protein